VSIAYQALMAIVVHRRRVYIARHPPQGYREKDVVC